MKNVFKVFGLIALVAVIGFSLAACGFLPKNEIIISGTPKVGETLTAIIKGDHQTYENFFYWEFTENPDSDNWNRWAADSSVGKDKFTLEERDVGHYIRAKARIIGKNDYGYSNVLGPVQPKGVTGEVPGGNGDGTGGNGGGTGGNGGGGGNTAGNTKENAIEVTVGYSSSYTISSSGEHWFKFTGTGDPVIFETTGNVVDTNMRIWSSYDRAGVYDNLSVASADDNSGEGSNALCDFTTEAGTTYWIRIKAGSSTSGTYTFVVKSPTSNLRANPITVSVGNSSSHTIFKSGTHWFTFTGTGDRVFFETEGDVVKTNLSIYIGDSTSSSRSKDSDSKDKGINFFTVSGTTYYIKVTGNSGTYTFIVRNGDGDGSSKYYAIEVTNGYSSSYTITSSGEHWFIYYGTGNKETFKTTGNVVDTNMRIWSSYDRAGVYDNLSVASDDNSGEGSNALCSFTTTSGTTYWIRIKAGSSTSGSYTFVVE